MNDRNFYRTEALNARQINWLGDIVLICPVSFTYLVFLTCLCALIVLLFLFFGIYTKRSTVTGQLVPDLGLVKVYGHLKKPPQLWQDVGNPVLT